MSKAAAARVSDQVEEDDADTTVVDDEHDDEHDGDTVDESADADEHRDDDAGDNPDGNAEGDDAGDGDGDGDGADADDDEVIVSLGDDTSAAAGDDSRAPEWVRELRKSNREKDRRIRDLEGQLSKTAAQQQPAAVGEKPTLEGCNFDTTKYEQELEAWHTRKREADDRTSAAARADEQQRAHWQTRIDAVTKAGTALKVKDYDDAGQAFEDQFSIVQQGIVIGGPDDPKTSALLRYALGKNPKKAKELASITDPVKFAFAVAKLETQLKVTPRKAAPPPDKKVASTVAGAAAVDNQLARLREEAAKTGDYSKVHAYKQTQRAKQRA